MLLDLPLATAIQCVARFDAPRTQCPRHPGKVVAMLASTRCPQIVYLYRACSGGTRPSARLGNVDPCSRRCSKQMILVLCPLVPVQAEQSSFHTSSVQCIDEVRGEFPVMNGIILVSGGSALVVSPLGSTRTFTYRPIQGYQDISSGGHHGSKRGGTRRPTPIRTRKQSRWPLQAANVAATFLRRSGPRHPWELGLRSGPHVLA